MLMQLASAWQSLGEAVGSADGSAHSSTSVQKKPLPQYPVRLHSQVYPSVPIAPTRLVHVASALHPCAPVLHSSMSLQVTPSPVKPGGHEHSHEPAVSTQ